MNQSKQRLVSDNSTANIELLDAGHFDVQLSIVRLKEKKEKKFYIKFDKITGLLYEVSPVKMLESNVRQGVLEINIDNEILQDILNSKLAYSKVTVKFDIDANDYILTKTEKNTFSEFNLTPCVFNKENSPIEISIGYRAKIISVTLNKIAYKNYLSSMTIMERELFNRDSIKFYFVNSSDYTKLYQSQQVSIRSLIKNDNIVIEANWLPDIDDGSVGVMHSDTNFYISLNNTIVQTEDTNNTKRPQILYKQKDKVITLQSIMEKTDNYNISDFLNFYVYRKNDPSVLVTKITVDKNNFDNFGNINLLISTSDKVGLRCDHEYLYIEDNDVSTHYKF